MANPVAADQMWFFDSLVIVRVSNSQGQDGLSVLEHRIPYGSSPPLHLHRTEDEVFQVLEGEFRCKIGDTERRLVAGDIVFAPKGVPHSYRVESASGGRGLAITARGDFERYVRAVGRPAERAELPPPAGPPSPDAMKAMAALAAQHGIEFVGPPMK